MGRVFNQAPLPFMGQKRRFVKEFKTALKNFNDSAIYIDLFGGSGLLSHIIRHEKPKSIVIYNDYDDYQKRIENISVTNKLIAKLRVITADLPKYKMIKDPYRSDILDLILHESQIGYVDYITLSSSLLFSMNYVISYEEILKQNFYNIVRQSNYDATGYLDNIEIVKMNYITLFEKWRYYPNVVFIIDPPYLFTEVSSYCCYWKLGNYLDVLQTVKDTSYFYFTSNKSQIIELWE